MKNRQYWIVTWREPHQWDRLCAILDATAEEVDQWVKTNRPNATDVCKYIALTQKEYDQLKEDTYRRGCDDGFDAGFTEGYYY